MVGTEITQEVGTLDSELTRNGGHWNRNWLGSRLAGLGCSLPVAYKSSLSLAQNCTVLDLALISTDNGKQRL